MTKKSLGQHWLKKPEDIDKIVRQAKLTKQDNVLEIGPGQGDMTFKLSKAANHVTAVELDQDLVNLLSRGDLPQNLTLVNSDIRDFDLNTMPAGYKVVANIPYYISGEIVRLLLEAENQPTLIVLLVQKEVAERITAQPGQMSVLSISTQLSAEVQAGPVVKAEAFHPPPKVDSQVVIIRPNEQIRIKVDSDKFLRLVKLAFSMKRKKLSNSLASIMGADIILDELGLAGLRPQELTFLQWEELYNRLYS